MIDFKYKLIEIEQFDSEFEFMESYVELYKYSLQILIDSLTQTYLTLEEGEEAYINIDREEAVVAGNLVRYVKLSNTFLQLTCENKADMAMIIGRCQIETYVNLIYFFKKNGSSIKRNYIKNSLIFEKSLWNEIKSNIIDNANEVSNIEQRMQNSIEKSFMSSDFEFEEVNESSKWKILPTRFKEVENRELYEICYGIMSHGIHGNWQDILFNHISKSGSEFNIKLNYQNSRPQMLDIPIYMTVKLIKEFSINKDSNYDSHKLEFIEKFHTKLHDGHEDYMELKKN